MAKVMNSAQVAHVWAQGTQHEGRTAIPSDGGRFGGVSGPRISFVGDTYFSYRTAVARLVMDKTGSRVALISSETFSPTTAMHIRHARSAVERHSRIGAVFHVPTLADDRSAVGRGDGVLDHSVNLASLMERYDNLAAGYANPRQKVWLGYPERSELEVISERLGTAWLAATDYKERFGLDQPLGTSFPPSVADVKAQAIRIVDQRAAYHAVRNTPEAIAKRQAAAAKRAAKLAAAKADAIGAWKRGEISLAQFEKLAGSYRLSDETGGALIRVKGDKLETSWRADVPLAHAVRAFRFIKHIRETGEDWRPNGHALRVGHFSVDVIRADGGFTAGCHTFAWPEIEAAAIAAGVFEAEACDKPEGC